METPKLNRRTVLKAGAGAAAFATTTNPDPKIAQA
jgi:TAT (twin-arginine translocation) pathway signal sequence